LNIDLTEKEFRRLLDLVYIGNWILNSTRTTDRFEDYDIVQEKIFSLCSKSGMKSLVQLWHGHVFPSRAYEDAVFFDILAEELARRDLGEDCDDLAALTARMDEYMDEFEANGVENLTLDV